MGKNNKPQPQKKGVAQPPKDNIFSATEKLWLEIADKAISKRELSQELKTLIEKEKSEHSVEELVECLVDLVKSYYTIKKEAEDSAELIRGKEKEIEHNLSESIKKLNEADLKFSEAQSKENDLSLKEAKLNTYEEALQNRELDITQREDNFEQGKYTGIVSQILTRLADSKSQIFAKTESLITKLESASGQYDEKASLYAIKLAEVEKEKVELASQITIYEKAKQSLKEDRENLEEAARENAREELQDELAEKDQEIHSLTIENRRVTALYESFKNKVEKIESEFENEDPVEMAKDYAAMKKELSEAMQKIATAPTSAQISRLQTLLDQRDSQIEDLESLLDRQKILEGEKLHDNTQFNLSEINILKDKITTFEYKEERYKDHLKTLQNIIDEMKADKMNCQDAFRFAKMYDADNEIQSKPRFGTDPNGLVGLVDYVQNKLALDIDEVGEEKEPLLYDKDLIRYFIAGLNMSQISILQGISGTGKTSLPREFIKAITAGIEEYYGNNEFYDEPNAPYRICEVQAGWRDSMDLMGYYNSFEKRYNETKFFKALYLANTPKYKDSLFFIILDEMNLSRPEHYFAEFLSLLEQEEEDRFIDVRVSEQNALPNLAKNGKLHVPKNIRFIGTANNDETTLEFAPKTYDRSNVIEMPKNKGVVENPKDMTRNISYSWLEKEFSYAQDEYKGYYLIFKDFIDKTVHNLFVSKGIGTGNRFDKQAYKFITVFIASGEESDIELSLAKAADFLITRRLFRTLKGNYDISREEMKQFRDSYEDKFFSTFGDIPHIAHDFFEEEIRKKRS